MRSTSISCIVSLDDPKIYYAAVKPSPISRLLKVEKTERTSKIQPVFRNSVRGIFLKPGKSSKMTLTTSLTFIPTYIYAKKMKPLIIFFLKVRKYKKSMSV